MLFFSGRQSPFSCINSFVRWKKSFSCCDPIYFITDVTLLVLQYMKTYDIYLCVNGLVPFKYTNWRSWVWLIVKTWMQDDPNGQSPCRSQHWLYGTLYTLWYTVRCALVSASKRLFTRLLWSVKPLRKYDDLSSLYMKAYLQIEMAVFKKKNWFI